MHAINKTLIAFLAGLLVLLLTACDSRPKSCLAMKEELVKLTKADKNFAKGAYIQSLEKVNGVFSDETMMECAGEVILSDNSTADVRYKAYKTDKEWKYEIKREYKTPECSDDGVLATVKNTSVGIFKQVLASSFNNRNSRTINRLSYGDPGFAFFGAALFQNITPSSIQASVQEVKFLRSTKYDKDTKIRSCEATLVFEFELPKGKIHESGKFAMALTGGYKQGALDNDRERKTTFTVTPDELNKGNFIIETKFVN